MINVTEEAAKKFNELKQKSKNPQDTMLRISYGGYGWGGPRFQLALEELKDQNDVVVESQGVKVIYASELNPYLNEALIDYSNNWFSRGFTINGGNSSSCQ